MAVTRARVLGGLLLVAACPIVAFQGCGNNGNETSGFTTPTATSTGRALVTEDAEGDAAPVISFGGGSTVSLNLDGDVPDRAPPPPACKLPGLWCYQTKAPCNTTLTGTVFDPAGQVPLDNVVVFVPADPTIPLPKITTGTGTNACGACNTQIQNYMALAVTDVDGNFTLTGVPATTDVPVVVQVGKWRRQITLSSVTKCVDNKVPNPLLRLPRSQMEGHPADGGRDWRCGRSRLFSPRHRA